VLVLNGENTISMDEMTELGAQGANQAMRPGKRERWGGEYIRHGTQTLIFFLMSLGVKWSKQQSGILAPKQTI